MKLDKKQIPQLIVLGVLLVACVGFVAFQLSGGNAVPPAPLKQADSASKTNGAAGAANDETQVAALTGSATEFIRRDPFQPVPLPIDPESIPPPPEQQAVTQHSKRPDLQANTGRVPPIGIDPFHVNTGTGGTIEIKPAGEEKDPDFTLTGIVRGVQNVAIIRVGQSGRYVVRPGQFVEGRYLVLYVTDDSATLVYKGRRIEIKLGGVKNAS